MIQDKNKLTFFAVIAKKTVDIVFEQPIDNIKEVNKNYVTPKLYECSDTTNNTNDDFLLSLMTGRTTVAVVSLF